MKFSPEQIEWIKVQNTYIKALMKRLGKTAAEVTQAWAWMHCPDLRDAFAREALEITIKQGVNGKIA